MVESATEEGPYFAALLAVAAIVEETGQCTSAELQACLASAGIEDFQSYVKILLEENGQGEDEQNPADPAQENDEELEEADGDAELGKEVHGLDEESE